MAHSLHFPLLRDLGLNETEAVIYELLLTKGPQPAVDLVNPSGLGRGNVYNALTNLIGRGLVEEEKGAKTLYRVINPEQLRTLAKQKKVVAEAVYDQLESILPGLKSSFRLFTHQPTVRVFEGTEGIKDIYKETVRDKQTIFAFVSPDEPEVSVFRWLTTHYVKARVEANIAVKVIVNGGSQAADYIAKNARELREARFIQNKNYPFRGEIDVFGDKVAFIAYKKEELIGVIIESAGIATTLRSVVQLLIDTLPVA